MKVMLRWMKYIKSRELEFKIKHFLTYGQIVRYAKRKGFSNIIIDTNTIKEDKIKCYVWFDNEDYEEDQNELC